MPFCHLANSFANTSGYYHVITRAAYNYISDKMYRVFGISKMKVKKIPNSLNIPADLIQECGFRLVRRNVCYEGVHT